MPELVACPSCGCKVQVADALLGRPVRCIGCGRPFAAGVTQPQPAPEPNLYRLAPGDEDAPPPPPPAAGRHLPLCPRCHRPVDWRETACPHCCHLLEAEDGGLPPWERRRDTLPHRGKLIEGLGSACLVCAVLGFCTGGLGVLAAVVTGLPALAMATTDLERMRRHELDPDGLPATEMGRNKAIVGLVVALASGAFLVLFYFRSIG